MINIGNYLKYFDNDRIDINRRIEIVGDDGTTSEELPKEPIYKDVKCDIQLKEIDNPNTNPQETTPVIFALKIYCSNSVDIKNNDYITAYKKDNKGNTIATYKGNSGQPYREISRTCFIMTIKEDV